MKSMHVWDRRLRDQVFPEEQMWLFFVMKILPKNDRTHIWSPSAKTDFRDAGKADVVFRSVAFLKFQLICV